MSNLGLGGLISGVNTDGIIQKLLDIENRRIDLESNKKAQTQAKQSAWSQVRSSLSALRSSLDSIRFPSLYRSRKATLTDDSVASVSASTGATATLHTLKVSNLAVAQVTGTTQWNSPTEQVGATYAGAMQINGKGIQVEATDSLYSIRDKINGLTGANATADVIQVVDQGLTKYRLVLTATKTGTDGAQQMPALASSDPTTVAASGTMTGSSAKVTVQQLALYKQIQSPSVTDTQTFTGSFTIRTNTKAYTIDVSDGATLGTIASRIKKAVGTDLDVLPTTANGQTQITLALPAGATEPVGLAVTNDTGGIAAALGLTSPDMSAANVAQQAIVTVENQTITSDSNTVVDPAGLTGLTLTLNNTSGGATVTVSSGVASRFGFNDIVSAQNALFSLDGVQYEKSSNVVSDILPGLTITLKKGGATTTNPAATADTTVTVSSDNDKVVSAVQGWVSALNNSIGLLADLTKYDSDSKKAGALQGDGLVRSLQTSLRSLMSTVANELPQGFRQLSDIGVTTGAFGTADYGKVLIDSDKLQSRLSEDSDGVARLLGALRKNVALGAGGATTAFSTTDTSDPTKVFSAADVINGMTDGSRFGSAGGGWQSDPLDPAPWLEVVFPQEVAIDELHLYLPDTTDYPASEGLKDFTIRWRTATGAYEDNDPLADVKGNLTAANTYQFTPRTVKAIRLDVTATNGGKPARVLELSANQVTRGMASDMYRFVNLSLGADGTLETRDNTYAHQIADADERIKRMSSQLEEHEKSLRAQFARMEAALAKMQSQGNALLGQMGALSGQK
jgi:flagellar capping protein FliD